MKIIKSAALVRGETLVNFALSNKGLDMNISEADSVGIAAAYIAKRCETHEMYEELEKALGHKIANRAYRAFKHFNYNGLWEQGPAIDDICFTNQALIKRYPFVNERQERIFN